MTKRRQRSISILLAGIVIKHRQFPWYVCLDSFGNNGYMGGASWYWGPARLSEVFTSVEAALPLKPLFPEGLPYAYGSRDYSERNRVLPYVEDAWGKWKNYEVANNGGVAS